MSRNAIYDALLAIGAAVAPGGVAWGETGRRMKDPGQTQMPALFQVENEEHAESQLGRLARRKLQVTWVIYHNTGADQTVAPARFTADAIDALLAALGPTPAGDQLTLSGQVFAAHVHGSIKRFAGDLDGVELVTIPITILLP